MLSDRARKGLQSTSDPKERKGLKEAYGLAPQCSPSEPPSNPRSNLRFARGSPAGALDSAPCLRLARGADLPSGERINSVSLEATPRQKGLVTHLLTRPPYRGIKCQQLHRNTRVRRRQATTPHSGCDQSPICQLRSLLNHPRHCGATVGTCDAL